MIYKVLLNLHVLLNIIKSCNVKLLVKIHLGNIIKKKWGIF